MRTLLFLSLAASLLADEFPKPFNTGTDVGKKPISADEAVKLIKMPEGFKATVFAAEPDVQNPIACAWDSRGRLWVAENYTYAESAVGFDKRLRDRILIFEDTDNDGKADKRTVFADNLHNLTSIELGYGGVYATAAPYLLWIPDADGDDKPDAANVPNSPYTAYPSYENTSTRILLDGFDAGGVRHNFVNGLRWGPDGWLYGRHGILATSKVGKPGTPDAERLPINVGIWRWHPTRHTVEMVTFGGTNPWGLDFNAEGEGFFTNTVTGHLYHMIPGAHYERMYGEDANPYIYQLLPQTADHYHYDRSKSWTASRDGAANDLGGGHAHVGCMIYQGENWPEQYRGKLFTINLHGRRINVNRLERKGSGYVGKSEPDMIFFGDPWFRGNELTYGPDGGVYVLDWSDQGECHENDGVHRESGRIYKITYGEVKKFSDYAVLNDGADRLADSAALKNGWLSSQSLQRIREQSVKGLITSDEYRETAIRRLQGRKDVVPFRRIQIARAGEFASRDWAKDEQLMLTNIDMFITAARKGFEMFGQQILSDQQARLETVSTLEWARNPVAFLPLWKEFLSHSEDATDAILPYLYWSQLQKIVGDNDAKVCGAAVDVAYNGKIPLILENTARRLATDITTKPDRIDGLLALAVTNFDADKAASITRGISRALRGVTKTTAPKSWPAFAAKAAAIPALADKVRELNVIFGDGRALDEIRAIALDEKADIPTRRQAVATLISSKDAGLREVCEKLVTNRDLTPVAIRGLATFDDPNAAKLAVENYGRVLSDDRAGVIGTLCSRAGFARALLDAIAAGKIARESITAYHARQLAALGDADVSKLLSAVWGEIRTTPDDKKRRMESLKAALTAEVLAKADIVNGRTVYTQTCAACHTLYDLGQTGANLGPNLTGSGRGDLNYLLENIVDPSAVVPADYKLSTITLKDGRVLSGFISAQNPQTLTLRTMTETQTLDRTTVAKTEASPQSLMPEGILDALKPEQIRDLFGFLMKK